MTICAKKPYIGYYRNVWIGKSKIVQSESKNRNRDNRGWNQNRGHTTNKKNRDSTSAKWVKNTYYLHIYGHFMLSDGCYFLSYRYNLVCVAHYFWQYMYDSLSYQYNFLWDAWKECLSQINLIIINYVPDINFWVFSSKYCSN